MILNIAKYLKNRIISKPNIYFMDNLGQFQYSKTKQSNSNTIKLTQSQKTNSRTQKNLIQYDDDHKNNIVNIPPKRNKAKVKLLIPDPSQTFEKLHKWRQTNIAPVDTIGCERLYERQQPAEIQKFQILISLMLSIQTKDQITSKATWALQEYGLTPLKMSQISQDKLVQYIYKCNFNKRKAKNIIQSSKIILEKGLPKSTEQLLDLPGVGMKIAMIYLRQAEGIQQGIGVDTHVHRISNLLGWVNTKNPNQTEMKLQQIFPKKYWKDINIAMVGFGQILCAAKKPLCEMCPLNKDCPSSSTKSQTFGW